MLSSTSQVTRISAMRLVSSAAHSFPRAFILRNRGMVGPYFHDRHDGLLLLGSSPRFYVLPVEKNGDLW